MLHVAQTTQKARIDPAQGGPITDDVLAEMIRLADELSAGTISHEGGTLILQNLAPVLHELAHRRRVMELVHQVSTPDNVVFLNKT